MNEVKTCAECGAPIIDNGVYIDNTTLVCNNCADD